MKQALKIISIVLVAIISAFCIGADVWYLYLRLSNQERQVSTTFKVGLVELADGTANYFAEVNLFRNTDNSGIAAYELKFNYLLDESQENFYSQGMQFTGNQDNYFNYSCDKNGKTPLDYHDYDAGALYWRKQKHYRTGYYSVGENYFNYASSDDYETAIKSANPLGTESFFKITLEGKVYGMKFNNEFDDSVDWIPTAAYYGPVAGAEVWYSKPQKDIFYFAKKIYDGCSSVRVGTNRAIVFEFGNMFDYFTYNNDTGHYDKMTNEKDTSLVKQLIKSYFCIKVNIYENGLTKASESLFNSVMGNSNYNTAGDYASDDYFIGRSVVTADIYDFDFVQVSENNYCLKLKDSFVQYYSQFKDSIYLDIVINLDELKKSNINFVGFTEDSNLDNFTVHKCVTRQTQDGRIVESEVPHV